MDIIVVGAVKVQMSIKDYLDSLGNLAGVSTLYSDVKSGVASGAYVIGLLGAVKYHAVIARAIGLMKVITGSFIFSVYAEWIDKYLTEIADTVDASKNAMEHGKSQIEIITNFQYYNTGRVSGEAIVYEKGSKSTYFQ